jgi:hypothetical protein
MKRTLDFRRFTSRSLECRKVGNSLVINPKGLRDSQTHNLARQLAPDPQHQLVIVDLTTRSPQDQVWEMVARSLDRKQGSFRLVLGPGSREESRAVAQRLADRLERTVVVPDGTAVPSAGGGLFIPPRQGLGWMRYQPGQPAVPDSRRFPKPRWESAVSSVPKPTSAFTIAEPLPGGMWLHANREDPGHALHRRFLIDQMVGQENLLTVVLGTPGSSPVPMGDIASFWQTLPASGRPLVLFVPYGPVAVPRGSTLGQSLADMLDFQVTLLTGLPATAAPSGQLPQTTTIRRDGSLGWRPFATGFQYASRNQSIREPRRPMVLGDRLASQGLPQIESGVYQFGTDAVVEVVPSGLWVRPPLDPVDANTVRSAPADPWFAAILFDETSTGARQRMRSLAEEIHHWFAPTFQELTQVMPSGFARRLSEANGQQPGAPQGGVDDQTRKIPPTALRAIRMEAASAARTPSPEPFSEHKTLALPTIQKVDGDSVAGAADPVGARPESAKDDDAPGTQVILEVSSPVAADPAPIPTPSFGDAADALLWVQSPEETSVMPRVVVQSSDPAQSDPAQSDPAQPESAQSESVATMRVDPGQWEPVERVAEDAGPDVSREPGAEDEDEDEPVTSMMAVEPQPVETEAVAPEDPEVLVQEESPAATAGVESSENQDAPALEEREADVVEEPATPAPAEIGAALKLESGPSPAEEVDDEARAPVVSPEPEASASERAAASDQPARMRVQPVPDIEACVASAENDLSEERDWLRRNVGAAYDEAEGFVTRVVSEMPGLQNTDKAAVQDTLTDLTAVRLYLTTPGSDLGDAMRDGSVGPHVPVGRCTASGLRRLPSHRGVVMLRAAFGDTAREYYPEDGLVTDWGFCTALTDAHPGLPGDTNVLIWALTARRTALLEPEVRDRVVFLPCTSFKVLRVHSGEPNVVMLRELASSEIGDDGRVEAGQVPLDQVALEGLEQAQSILENGRPGVELPAAYLDSFGTPPGLIPVPH